MTLYLPYVVTSDRLKTYNFIVRNRQRREVIFPLRTLCSFAVRDARSFLLASWTWSQQVYLRGAKTTRHEQSQGDLPKGDNNVVPIDGAVVGNGFCLPPPRVFQRGQETARCGSVNRSACAAMVPHSLLPLPWNGFLSRPALSSIGGRSFGYGASHFYNVKPNKKRDVPTKEDAPASDSIG